MNSTIASALVIVIELILRGACVFAILRVTLTLFKIDKAEKAEKERDAAITWVPQICGTCNVNYTEHNCDYLVNKAPGHPCPHWEFCGKTHREVYGDDEC